MKKGYTAILTILDTSGSMQGIAHDIEKGLRKMAAEQDAAPGTCTFDVVKFNSTYTYTQSMASAERYDAHINADGYTALWDAIVKGTIEFRQKLDKLPDNQKPEHVQIVVATDGEENSSKSADAVLVRDTIQWHTDQYGYDFTFLGSNQDAVYAGQLLGFEGKKSMTFTSSSSGVTGMTSGLSDYISQTRAGRDAGYDDSHRKASV